MDFLEVFQVLARNGWLLAGVPLAAALIALGIAFVLPPAYVAETRVLPPQMQNRTASMLMGHIAGVSGLRGELKNPPDVYVAMLKSRSAADALVGQFRLAEVFGAGSPGKA